MDKKPIKFCEYEMTPFFGPCQRLGTKSHNGLSLCRRHYQVAKEEANSHPATEPRSRGKGE